MISIGDTSESADGSCPGASSDDPWIPFTIPAGPWWTSTFIATHYKEAEEGGSQPAGSPRSLLEGGIPLSTSEKAYTTIHWTVYEAERMATKEWSGASDVDPDVFEGGEFRLIHKPEK